MNAPIGFYVNSDDAQCADCHDPGEWSGFEDWQEPSAIFDGTIGDAPTHCIDCGSLIPHGLTADGYGYVAERLARRDGRPDILDKWAQTYGAYLDDYVDVERDALGAHGFSGSDSHLDAASARALDRLDRLRSAGSPGLEAPGL